MIKRRHLCIGLASPLLSIGQGAAYAQTRTSTMVVPYPPGGSTDLLGRAFTDALSQEMGDKYIVENRPGANGIVGATAVAKAPPDGHTLLYAYGNLLLNQEFMMKDQSFRTLEMLTPIVQTAVVQAVIVAAANHPAADLREFIAMARQNPGKYSYAYYGDLAVPSVVSEADINLLRVPYKGGMPGMIDVAAGTADIIYSSVAQAQPMLRAGKLKALGVSGNSRLSEWPNVPTIKEILPGYSAADYQVVFGPRNLPPATLDKLIKHSKTVLGSQSLKKYFLDRGAVIDDLSGSELRAFMEKDRARIGKVVKAAGILPE